MNRLTYILINILAIFISFLLIIFGYGFAKLFGLIGFIFIIWELFSGRYKQYMKGGN